MNDTNHDIRELLERGYPQQSAHPEWDDVLERLEHFQPDSAQHNGPRSLAAERRRNRIATGRVAAFASVAAVAVGVALTVTTPWRGGPTIVERATAAIAGPTSTQVLYESIVIHSKATFRGPPVTTHIQLWLAGSRPRHFRVLIHYPVIADRARPTSDIGGSLGSYDGLTYDAASKTLDPVAFQFPIEQEAVDPATWIKAALTSGKAQLDGTTTITGRAVRRILLTLRISGRLVVSAQYFVDARTYDPVRIIVDSAIPDSLQYGVPSSGLLCLPYCYTFSRPPAAGKPRYEFAYDFARYQYLPPTTDNLNLTNIQAEHPSAKIV